MRTLANRSNRTFALPLDANGLSSDVTSGMDALNSSGEWNAGSGRFGEGAYLFNTTTKYLQYPNDSRFILGGGTQNFHIGAWVKLTTLNAYACICECDPSSGRRFSFRCRNNNAQPVFYMTPGTTPILTVLGPATAMGTTGVWKYICCQRVGNVYTLYVDGVGGAPVTYTGDFVLHTTRTFQIGHMTGQASGWSLGGYLQGFEISAPGTLLDIYGGKRPLR